MDDDDDDKVVPFTPPSSLPPTVAARKPFGEKVNTKSFLPGECPEITWAVEELLCEQDVFLLSGEGGIGKSYILVELALALAEGRALFNRFPISRAYRVLYLDAEMSRTAVNRRLWRMIRGLGTKACPANLDIWRGGHLQLDQGGAPEMKSFIAYVKETKPEWILIDSQRRVMGGDENNSTDTNRFYSGVRTLRDGFELGIGFVAHTRKTTGEAILDSARQRLRGSTDIPANLDAHIAVDAATRDHHLIVTPDKKRHANSAERKPFVIRFAHDDPDDDNTPFRMVYVEDGEEKAGRAIVEQLLLLAGVTGATTKELMEKGKLSRKAVRVALQQLKADGVLVQAQTYPIRYILMG